MRDQLFSGHNFSANMTRVLVIGRLLQMLAQMLGIQKPLTTSRTLALVILYILTASPLFDFWGLFLLMLGNCDRVICEDSHNLFVGSLCWYAVEELDGRVPLGVGLAA